VGDGLAGRDRADDRVDACVELGHALHVEGDVGEIVRSPAQERDDAVDHALDRGWRRLLLAARATPTQARSRPALIWFRQARRDDAERRPGDAAAADRGIEQSVASVSHAPNVASVEAGRSTAHADLSTLRPGS